MNTRQQDDELEAKMVRVKGGCYYGTPQISSILAGFESNIMQTYHRRARYKPGSKAYAKHYDRIRLAAATRMLKLLSQTRTDTIRECQAALPKKRTQTQPSFMSTAPWPPINEVEAYNEAIDQVRNEMEGLL